MKLLMNNKIQKKLNELKRSQGWLARITGYERAYVSKLVNSLIPTPTIQTCLKIAKALNCSVEDIWILDKKTQEEIESNIILSEEKESNKIFDPIKKELARVAKALNCETKDILPNLFK